MAWEIDVVSRVTGGMVIAIVSTLAATLLSLRLVYKHLRHYNQPDLQRPIARILLMVPIYAVSSLLSLLFMDGALYFDLLRDCYEAYVMYAFFYLLLAYIRVGVRGRTILELEDPTESGNALGGRRTGGALKDEEEVVRVLEMKEKQLHPWPLCWLRPVKLGRRFLVLTKRCILQFMFVKPAMAVLAIVLEQYDLYGEGSLSLVKGYIYIAAVDNVSISIAMYFLILFYYATEEELRPWQPVPKFVCIKTVIFLTFWQGLAIDALSYFKVIHGDLAQGFTDQDVSTGLQEFLICLEMFLVAIAHSWTFSHAPFVRAEDESSIPCYECLCCCCCCCQVTRNFGNVVSQSDLIEESVEVFGINQVPDAVHSGIERGGDFLTSIASRGREKDDASLANDASDEQDTHDTADMTNPFVDQ